MSVVPGSAGPWPAHGHEVRPWHSATRGPRADRLYSEVTVSLPPFIADLPVPSPVVAAAHVDQATTAIGRLDSTAGRAFVPMSALLARTDAIASSRIEHIKATPTQLARAAAGLRAPDSAVVTLAAGQALNLMIARATTRGVRLDDLLEAHRLLMAGDLVEGPFAGQLRTMQNWIGGSDYSPRGADYVPPPPDLVPALMEDLIRFASRDDLPAVAQAAIAHAQFESIHPFTDGNGRIGRALVGAILAARGLLHGTVVPVAAALAGDTGSYFGALTAYRGGDVGQVIGLVADALGAAARESEATARNLDALPAEWKARAKPRTGSAAAKLIERLVAHPVIGAEDAASLTGSSSSSAYAAIDTLVAAGVLTPISESKRHRAWAAMDVLAEAEDLTARLRKR
ncbi:MAG: Fic family protein [Bifidobacteriaceae bacterium]|nr:Fic family protein [Bifidobacteriaceae bacterium]